MAAYSRQKDIYSGLNKVSVQLLLFLHAHAALDVGAGSGQDIGLELDTKAIRKFVGWLA